MPIEPRIRPLVDALNRTGLVQTFTSCEGHYGDGPATGSSGRERANVGFFVPTGVPEGDLVRLFGAVLAFVQLHDRTGAELTVEKHYAAALDGSDGPETFFDFTIRPSCSNASATAKREATDRCLEVVTVGVERATAAAAPPPGRDRTASAPRAPLHVEGARRAGSARRYRRARQAIRATRRSSHATQTRLPLTFRT